MCPGEKVQDKQMVQVLLSLLDRQIQSIQNDRFDDLKELTERSSELIHQVVKTNAFQNSPTCKTEIVQKYLRIQLMLEGVKTLAKDELKQVLTTKKMLAVYRNSNR